MYKIFFMFLLGFAATASAMEDSTMGSHSPVAVPSFSSAVSSSEAVNLLEVTPEGGEPNFYSTRLTPKTAAQAQVDGQEMALDPFHKLPTELWALIIRHLSPNWGFKMLPLVSRTWRQVVLTEAQQVSQEEQRQGVASSSPLGIFHQIQSFEMRRQLVGMVNRLIRAGDQVQGASDNPKEGEEVAKDYLSHMAPLFFSPYLRDICAIEAPLEGRLSAMTILPNCSLFEGCLFGLILTHAYDSDEAHALIKEKIEAASQMQGPQFSLEYDQDFFTVIDLAPWVFSSRVPFFDVFRSVKEICLISKNVLHPSLPLLRYLPALKKLEAIVEATPEASLYEGDAFCLSHFPALQHLTLKDRSHEAKTFKLKNLLLEEMPHLTFLHVVGIEAGCLVLKNLYALRDLGVSETSALQGVDFSQISVPLLKTLYLDNNDDLGPHLDLSRLLNLEQLQTINNKNLQTILMPPTIFRQLRGKVPLIQTMNAPLPHEEKYLWVYERVLKSRLTETARTASGNYPSLIVSKDNHTTLEFTDKGETS